MSGCEDTEEHGNYCDECFTCHDCLEEGREVDDAALKILKAHVADLDKKLDQVIDMLDTNGRVHLLELWAKP